jgi:hypothetical protein
MHWLHMPAASVPGTRSLNLKRCEEFSMLRTTRHSALIALFFAAPIAFAQTDQARPIPRIDLIAVAQVAPPPRDAASDRILVEVAALDSVIATVRPHDHFLIAFPQQGDLPCLVETAERTTQATLLSGRVDAHSGGRFTLTVLGDQITADVHVARDVFQLRTDMDGGHWCSSVSTASIPECGTDDEHARLQPAPAAPNHDHAPAGTRAGIVDVLAVYTPSARAYFGGDVQARNTIRLWFLDLEQYLANSEVGTNIRLVHVGPTSFQETGVSANDLFTLRELGETPFSDVGRMREEHVADLVALIVADSDVCGLAYLPDINPNGVSSVFGYSLSVTSCGSLTMAHELGHNFGCCHDRANAGGGCYDGRSYGYRFHGMGGELFRTIMAYEPGTRIGYFSNPNVNFDNVATGTATEYNAATIDTTSPYIAQYREAPQIIDCNGNGIDDAIDIGSHVSVDCNDNLVPDECDLATGGFSDLNGNGVIDVCDPDCNQNLVPDDLDILGNASLDCNANDIPDECDADTDHDNLPNDCDNCPTAANLDQADTDGDGTGEACDVCPGRFNPQQLDSDADHRGDECDNCPNTANTDQADADGDGVGNVCDNCLFVANASQADRDGDGAGDACDNCPDTPNAAQTDSDGDGIGDACEPPVAAPPSTPPPPPPPTSSQPPPPPTSSVTDPPPAPAEPDAASGDTAQDSPQTAVTGAGACGGSGAALISAALLGLALSARARRT